MHRANSFVYCMFLSLLLLLVCMVFCCCSVYKYCLVLYVVRFERFGDLGFWSFGDYCDSVIILLFCC